MTLPVQYAWLSGLVPPKTISEGLKLYGTEEKVGSANNPVILAWAKELGLEHSYVADSIPWCGLFVALVVERAGWPVIPQPLWARNWAKWERASPIPGLGDVLVFKRENSGHVAFYVGEDETAFHTLGGNPGDRVSIIRIDKNRLIAARRPVWKIAQPDSVKPYRLAKIGALSQNEA